MFFKRRPVLFRASLAAAAAAAALVLIWLIYPVVATRLRRKTPPTPPEVTLTAAPNPIQRGESATLEWKSANTSALFLEPEIGRVQPSGSLEVTPAGTTAYTITGVGPGGRVAAQVTIAVANSLFRVTDHVICRSVGAAYAKEKRCVRPAPVSRFSKSDKEVWLWFQVEEPLPGLTAEIQWIDPLGQTYRIFKLEPGAGRRCYAYSMSISGTPAAGLPGKWEVRVTQAGTVLLTSSFTIEQGP